MKGAPLRWAPVLRAHFRLGCKGDKHSSFFAYSISDEKEFSNISMKTKTGLSFRLPAWEVFFVAKRPSLKLKFHFFDNHFLPKRRK